MDHHEFIPFKDPEIRDCVKCGRPKRDKLHGPQPEPEPTGERMISQPYIGPHAVLDQDDLRFIRSVLPLEREETKRVMPKINAALDSDWNKRADARAAAIARRDGLEEE